MDDGRVFYFGCWERSGHFLYDKSGRHVDHAGPFKDYDIDGRFAPKTEGREVREDESLCSLVQERGWTVMAMWDRSVDKRFKSNCAFIAPGERSQAEMWELALQNFPQIVPRLKAAAHLQRGKEPSK